MARAKIKTGGTNILLFTCKTVFSLAFYPTNVVSTKWCGFALHSHNKALRSTLIIPTSGVETHPIVMLGLLLSFAPIKISSPRLPYLWGFFAIMESLLHILSQTCRHSEKVWALDVRNCSITVRQDNDVPLMQRSQLEKCCSAHKRRAIYAFYGKLQ